VKLYYTPGACSLAAHIALIEAGLEFDLVRVDLRTRLTESGADFSAINDKGYVPMLVLDEGAALTENAAVLDWLAMRFPQLGVDQPLGRTRLIEMLVYLSTEVHKGFKPFWHGTSMEERAGAEIQLIRRFRWLADHMQGRYLFGDQPTVADLYLFVMLRWAVRFGIAIPEALASLQARLMARPAVRDAIEAEESPVKRVA
jgi:glutathione S-transferase